MKLLDHEIDELDNHLSSLRLKYETIMDMMQDFHSINFLGNYLPIRDDNNDVRYNYFTSGSMFYKYESQWNINPPGDCDVYAHKKNQEVDKKWYQTLVEYSNNQNIQHTDNQYVYLQDHTLIEKYSTYQYVTNFRAFDGIPMSIINPEYYYSISTVESFSFTHQMIFHTRQGIQTPSIGVLYAPHILTAIAIYNRKENRLFCENHYRGRKALSEFTREKYGANENNLISLRDLEPDWSTERKLNLLIDKHKIPV